MRKIIIASHGELSVGLKSSLALIVGEAANEIITFTLNPGESTDDFRETIEPEIQKNPGNEYAIFTDLLGASVFNSLAELDKYENAFVFAGVNLVLLIDMMLDSQPLTAELCESKVLNARNALIFYSNRQLNLDEENEF